MKKNYIITALALIFTLSVTSCKNMGYSHNYMHSKHSMEKCKIVNSHGKGLVKTYKGDLKMKTTLSVKKGMCKKIHKAMKSNNWKKVPHKVCKRISGCMH